MFSYGNFYPDTCNHSYVAIYYQLKICFGNLYYGEMVIRHDFDADVNKEHGKAEFKLLPTVLFCVAFFALLALVSYSPEDVNFIYGGTSAPPANWIGPSGAKFSWYMLLNFGLVSYFAVILLLLRTVRLFFPEPGRFSRFLGGFLLLCFGLLLLLGLEPAIFAPVAANLGLGRMAIPELSLPAGVIGQVIAAPPLENSVPGLFPGLIGVIGTMVAGWIFTVAGITMLYINDWYVIFRMWMMRDENDLPSGKKSRRPVLADDYDDSEYDEDEEDDVAMPFRFNRKNKPEEKPLEVEETDEKPSRLRDIFRLGEDEEDDETSAEKANNSDELFDEFDSDDEPEKVDTPVAAAAAARVPETPAVSTRVVQQGEKLRGEFGDFVLPPISMLAKGANVMGESRDAIELASAKIQQTLDDFGIAGRVTGFVSGPRVTRYEITLDPGISVRKVEQIQDNIRMALAATTIRVLAPIPGRSVVGVEVSNTQPEAVFMSSVMDTEEWKSGKAEIPLALGKNVSGKPVILDLAKAPHMLVAGATGTGKSVCSNSLIMSMLFRFRPDELRLIMVDPKIVEFDAYKNLPHLLTPIINDSAKVPIALRWAANEMDRRYHVLAKVGVKKLSEFNNRRLPDEPEIDDDGNPIPEKMPLLVIILDELADLMMTEAKKDVETNITRIAQKGRAAGIHIIVATQRPSTNIITGVIKANLPTRLCFQVRSLVDSRVVLDTPGAEKLLGTGDMLVMTSSSMEIERVQGAFVKDDDIKKVVQFISDQAPQRFNDNVLAEPDDNADDDIDENYDPIDNDDRADIAPLIKKYMRPEDDDTFRRALEVVIVDREASTSYIQRRLKIGYNRAADIVDTMEQRGILGPPSGSGKKREILIFDGFDIGD